MDVDNVPSSIVILVPITVTTLSAEVVCASLDPHSSMDVVLFPPEAVVNSIGAIVPVS